MNKPKRIFIHCAATPDKGLGFDAFDVDKWHKRRGWRGCGYHAFITLDGKTQDHENSPCRPPSLQGAHTYDERNDINWNVDSLGLCMDGTRDFKKVEILAAITKVKKWQREFNIPNSEVYCHYEKDDTDCPHIPGDMFRLLLELASLKAEQCNFCGRDAVDPA